MSIYLQVLRTYTSRKTLWFMLLLYSVMYCQVHYSIVNHQDDKVEQVAYPQMQTWLGHTYTLKPKDLARNSLEPDEITHCTIHDQADTEKLAVVGAYPALKHISLVLPIDGQLFREVFQARQFESITINNIHGISLAEWSGLLQSQTRLKFLSIGLLANPAQLHEPQEDFILPQTLETLVLTDVRGTNLQLLKRIVSLPKLKQLAINLYPISTKSTLDDNQLDLLRQAKSLERLYLAEVNSANSCHLVQNTQSALPHVWVRPNRYQETPTLHAGSILGLCIIPFAVILVHLSGQFLLNQANLIPLYKSKHLLIGLLIYLPFLVGGYWLSRSTTLSLDSTLALILFPVVPFVLFTLIISKSPGYTLFVQPLMLFPGIVFTSCFSLVAMLNWPVEINWWLRGERLDVSLYLLLAELIGLAYLGREMVNLNSMTHANGTTGISLNIYDFKSFQDWSVKCNKREKEVGYRKLLLTFMDNPLNQMLTNPQAKLHPARMWQAASPLSMWNPAIYIMMFVFMSPMEAFFIYSKGFNRETIFMLFILLLFAIIFAGIINPLVMLMQRRSTMTLDFLRTSSRHEVIQAMWQSLFHELTPSYIALFTMSLTLSLSYKPELLIYGLLFSAILCLLIYYLILLLITFKYVSIILLLACPVLFLSMLVVIWILGEDVFNSLINSFGTHTGLCLLALFLTLSTYLLQHYAQSRWQNLEPASLIRS